MKIAEAQSAYRAYRQQLINQTKALMQQRDKAKQGYEATGSSEFSQQAATLQLSIDKTRDLCDKNEEVLDSLAEQHSTEWNAEVAKQQADAESGVAVELGKILAVARRISMGDRVPSSDERKLMEYSKELYMAAKSAQMLHEMEEHKTHESLWEEEEDPNEYDPQGKADNAQAQGTLADIQSEIEALSAEIAGSMPESSTLEATY